jgi:hypothetical protein
MDGTVGVARADRTAGVASTSGTAGAEGASGTAGREGASAWSQPATLSSCPGTGTPHVVFPSDSPTHGTGPGAIVWSAAYPCHGGAGVRVAVISAADIPGAAGRPRGSNGQTLGLRGPLSASAGPYGRIVIAAASTGGAATPAGELMLTEGQAGGPFTRPIAPGGPASSFAFSTGYLGDVALLSMGGTQLDEITPPPGETRSLDSVQPGVAGTDAPLGEDAGSTGGVQLGVQRHYANRFAAPLQVSTGPGADAGTGASAPIDALTVALDYRSDALAVWAQQGSVYARELPASGTPHPVQRLGPCPLTGARIAAVISDDDRAIVTWTDRRAGESSVYVSRSQTGVRFGAPELIERFHDPNDLTAYAASPRIVRLSSESVMMAWTGIEADHLVIRAAAIDLHGVRAPSTISPPGSNALLDALAPGPENEVLALWSEPQQTPTGLDLQREAVFAARGFNDYPGQTAFSAPEQVAAPGPNREASVALDPGSDRAIAVWRTGAGAVAYAVRSAGAIAYAIPSAGRPEQSSAGGAVDLRSIVSAAGG